MQETNNYLVKVLLRTTDETSGKEKRITELYVVEAVNVTDAEAIITKEFEGGSTFECVSSVTESKIIKFIAK